MRPGRLKETGDADRAPVQRHLAELIEHRRRRREDLDEREVQRERRSLAGAGDSIAEHRDRHDEELLDLFGRRLKVGRRRAKELRFIRRHSISRKLR